MLLRLAFALTQGLKLQKANNLAAAGRPDWADVLRSPAKEMPQ